MVFPAISQEISISYSEEMTANKFRFAAHLYSDDDNHYAYFEPVPGLFSSSISIHLKKYDKDFNEIYDKPLKVKKKEIYSEGIKYFGGQFIWLQYQNDIKGKKNKYDIVPINLEGEIGESKRIATLDKGKGLFRNVGHDSKWKINKDQSKLLFYAEKAGYSKEDKYQIYISLINDKLEKIWDKQIEMPYVQNKLEITNIEFGTDNSVYVIAKVYMEESGKFKLFKKNRPIDYTISIFKISKNEDLAEYKLRLKDELIEDVFLTDDPSQNELALIGFTGETTKGEVTGILHMKMHKESGKVIFAKSRKFTKKEIESFGMKSTDVIRKGKKRSLENAFEIKNIVFNKDGGMTVAAEQYYETYTTDNFGHVRRTDFYNNHILVMEINSEGIVAPLKMIPKRIKRKEDGHPIAKNLQRATHLMFFASFIHNGKSYYLYDDDRSNFENNITDPDEYKRLKKASKSIALISHYDDTGLVRKKLFDYKDIKSSLAPKFCKQISPNQMFFLSHQMNWLKPDKFRIGVIRIED